MEWIDGSAKGGRTAATLCSFILSCQRHEIDPFAYLRDGLAEAQVLQKERSWRAAARASFVAQ